MTFPGLAEIRQSLEPAASHFATELGSRADFHKVVPVAQKDKSFKPVPQLFAHDIAIRLRTLTSEQAQEIFGTEAKVDMRGSMLRTFATVKLGNVIEVIDGEFKGQWLKVEKLIERPLTNSYVLGLLTTEALR